MSHDVQQYARALWSGKENLTNSIRFLFSSFGLTIQKSFFILNHLNILYHEHKHYQHFRIYQC